MYPYDTPTRSGRCTRHRKSLTERFEALVQRQDGCWAWTGDLNPDGYGRFPVPMPTRSGGWGAIGAHRFALEQRLGRPLAPGMRALHTCDVRSCVRNDDEGTYEVNGIVRIRFGHLWEGTLADNSADAAAKGRMSSGDNHYSRLHPERLARGDRHPLHVYPGLVRRGSQVNTAKLTEAQVVDIRCQISDGIMQTVIAKQYGVSKHTVHLIAHGKIWRHVP